MRRSTPAAATHTRVPPERCSFCAEWAFTTVRLPGGLQHHICLQCYERRRELTLVEKAFLARRENVPQREAAEPAADYVARAIAASQPTETKR